MCNECNLHDQFGTNFSVKNSSEDHGNRKTKEPHRVDGTKLNGVQAQFSAKLGEDSRPDTEREGCCNERKTARQKKTVCIDGLSHCKLGLVKGLN